jgi:hypothetical protein
VNTHQVRLVHQQQPLVDFCPAMQRQAWLSLFSWTRFPLAWALASENSNPRARSAATPNDGALAARSLSRPTVNPEVEPVGAMLLKLPLS